MRAVVSRVTPIWQCGETNEAVINNRFLCTTETNGVNDAIVFGIAAHPHCTRSRKHNAHTLADNGEIKKGTNDSSRCINKRVLFCFFFNECDFVLSLLRYRGKYRIYTLSHPDSRWTTDQSQERIPHKYTSPTKRRPAVTAPRSTLDKRLDP